MNVNEINASVLAFLGDSIYEVLVRQYLIKNKINNVNDLQKEAVKFVSAKNQSQILDDLLLRQILTEDELYTIKRARNNKPKSKPKYTSMVTYKKATALEALFGMLYINKDFVRIEYIFKEIVGE